MITDPISDMLTRIRNAQMVKAKQTRIPTSKFKLAVLEVLKNSKYIKNYKTSKKDIIVELEYPFTKPAISKIKTISKPGLRIYKSSKKIRKVLQGFGIVIISTPQGVMTGKQAKQKNLGGEIICEVY